MSLHDKALLVSLSLSLFSPKKTDRQITARVLHEHQASAGALRVAKRLLPDEAVEPIRKLHQEIREYHAAHTLPWSADNERLLSTLIYLEYMDWMRQRRGELERAVAAFLQAYPQHIEEAKRQLNGAFKQADYPSAEAITRKFAFRLECKPVPEAGDFRISLQREEMDALRADLNARVEQAEQAAKLEAARRLTEPLAALVNRLSDPEAVFRDTLVTNLRSIVDLLPALNLTGDAGLEAARQRILAGLYHADPETLRANPSVRARTAAHAQDILDQVSDYFGPLEDAAA